MSIDIDGLRQSAAELQRLANSLPVTDPNRLSLSRAASSLDEAADEIEAMSPLMRADLEDMLASVRRH